MAFDNRKLLLQTNFSVMACSKHCNVTYGNEYCEIVCEDCPGGCNQDNPPPTPPPPPPPIIYETHHGISSNLIVMACVIGGAFLFGVCCIILLHYYSKWRNSRMMRRSLAILDDTHEDFADEDLGPLVIHPIWFITTVGLQQSVIDSITVFKYKKDEGLIEGTECSVCLSEFQEDESLRLLPKCSHAFHIPCIDTWLRSHKNCPLCRAPVVSDTLIDGHVSAVEPDLNDLVSREETQVENFENNDGMMSLQEGEGGSNEMRVGDDEFATLPIDDRKIDDILSKGLLYSNARNYECRVQSDLADNRRMVEEELQPVRRSVSMDSSSASVIYRAMANVLQEEHEGTSDSRLVKVKKLNSEIVLKRGSGSSSIYRLMKSPSSGHSLQKGPISMKRSFSSGRKFLSFRNSGRRNTTLPL